MGSVLINLYMYEFDVSMSSDIMSICLKERDTMRCLQVGVSIHTNLIGESSRDNVCWNL